MSQSWDLPSTPDDVFDTAVITQIPNALLALLSLHSGDSEPSFTVPYMLWAQGSTNTLWMRNASNDGWLAVCSLTTPRPPSVLILPEVLSLSSTRSFAVHMPVAGTIKRVVILSDTATTSSSGNQWRFELDNLTQAEALFSAEVGTFTTLGGVGGGEISGNTVYALVPDQNTAVAKDDVLELTLNADGTVTTLDRFAAFIEYDPA